MRGLLRSVPHFPLALLTFRPCFLREVWLAVGVVPLSSTQSGAFAFFPA